eukprot:2578617-Amphidinium_carterae.2
MAAMSVLDAFKMFLLPELALRGPANVRGHLFNKKPAVLSGANSSRKCRPAFECTSLVLCYPCYPCRAMETMHGNRRKLSQASGFSHHSI